MVAEQQGVVSFPACVTREKNSAVALCCKKQYNLKKTGEVKEMTQWYTVYHLSEAQSQEFESTEHGCVSTAVLVGRPRRMHMLEPLMARRCD